MNQLRLRKLIETLQHLPEGLKFDMGMWVLRGDCGTAACALGSAALDPWHRAHGLRVHPGAPWFDGPKEVQYFTCQGGWVAGYSAGSRYFEIPYEVSCWLFEPNAYRDKISEGVYGDLPPGTLNWDVPITPEDVIERIEWLLNNDPNAKEAPNADSNA